MKAATHLTIIVFLTVLSQFGGIAWLVGLCFRRRTLVFFASYIVLSVAALWVAPHFGRVPLSCGSGGVLQMQSKFYCALNRQYVVPELKTVLTDFATNMDHAFPGTQTRVLDANFPFLTGFPLLPHLSHDDGRKADIALYYANDQGYLPGVTRSPIGYFAFEAGPTDCPDKALTLRWNFGWLQNLWPHYHLAPHRMATALQMLGADERLGKIFVEPHLQSRFNAHSARIRFQGCRAARHDDHIHIQL